MIDTTEERSIVGIFDDIDAEVEANLPYPGDPPVGKYLAELAENVSYAYGISRRTGKEWSRRKIHLVVRETLDGQPYNNRHIFLDEFVANNDASMAQSRTLAKALDLDPVEGSYIKALRPSYVPAEAVNALDGGVVEDTAGKLVTVRIWRGKARVNPDTDQAEGFYFNHEFSPVRTVEAD